MSQSSDAKRPTGGLKGRWLRLEHSPWYRRAKRLVRQFTGKEPRCRVDVARETESFGGWTVSRGDLPDGCRVYSLGVGRNVDFDLAMIERFGAEVFAFDPTPAATGFVEGQELPERFRYHELGVADYDGQATFQAPLTADHVSYTMTARRSAAGQAHTAEVRKLSTLMAMLGHDRIDLLKMDIEGAEYGVIEEIVAGGIEVAQLLVEFHHRFEGIGVPTTAAAIRRLRETGYRVFDISPKGWEIGFVRCT